MKNQRARTIELTIILVLALLLCTVNAFADGPEKTQIVVTGSEANGKTYDGTTVASVVLGTVSGIADGDDVEVIATGTFENKNIGLDKKVVITYKLTGEDKDKYLVPEDDLAYADITPKPVNVFNSTVVSKAYDGNTKAVINIGQVEGIIAGDDVSVSATGTFADENIGTGISVEIIYQLSGADAGNYIQPADGSSAGDITKLKYPQIDINKLNAQDQSAEGVSDGKIGGLNNSMEYKKLRDSEYLPITKSYLENLEPGVYLIRYKADVYHDASDPVQIEIKAFEDLESDEPEENPDEPDEPIVPDDPDNPDISVDPTDTPEDSKKSFNVLLIIGGIVVVVICIAATSIRKKKNS